jgi:hypothetical protein
MKNRTWRIAMVFAAMLIVPALMTSGVFFGFHYADKHRFNRCLGAIPQTSLKDPGVAFILDGIQGTGRYEGATWNINKPYRADAYNILVPSGDVAKWPQVCQVPEEVPDCLASPSNRYIICNPAMGHQFESRLLHSGVASIETDAAMRFVLLTFLGHELGHIADGHSSRVRHLTPGLHEGSLSCVHHPTAVPSDEERADEYGTELACKAVVRQLSTENLPVTLEESQILVSRLEDQLDDSYFLRDDACVGDLAYPSIGRRKHTFALKYLKCLYSSQWNPVEVLAEEDAKSFDNLESWLDSRQKSGQVASGSYGLASLYAHTVTALPEPNSYLTFDSTGVDSRLWLIQPDRGGGIEATALKTWSSVGRVLASVPSGQGRRFWISFSHGAQPDTGVLMNLDVACPRGAQSCGQVTPLKSLPVESGFLPHAGPDDSVVLVSKDMIEQPVGGAPDSTSVFSTVPHGLGLASADEAVVAVSGNEVAVFPSKGDGLHGVSVLRDGVIHRRLLMMQPTEGETLEAAAIAGNRLLLSSHVEPLVGDGSLYLLDCPAAILERSSEAPQDNCTRYQAP